MSKGTTPQYAQVEQPFGCDSPLVHCPICGNATLEMTEEGGVLSPCPHLAFVYFGEAKEFGYRSRDFENRTKGIDNANIEFDKFPDFLEKAGYNNKMLAIEITYGEMVCGPVWCTDVYGFDYGTLAKKNESDKNRPD